MELSPIEVAIDEMQSKISELEEVVVAQTIDAKKLQLRLQGSGKKFFTKFSTRGFKIYSLQLLYKSIRDR